MSQKQGRSGSRDPSVNVLSELMPAIHFLLIFGCSAIAAWLLYGFLVSTGVVSSKSFQLGGAAAGFVVIFGISHRILRSLFQQYRQSLQVDKISEQEETISQLHGTIQRLRSGELPPVICPENFMTVVSRDDGIALACPTEWERLQEHTVAAIMRPQNEEIAALNFRGNIFITSTPLNSSGSELLQGLKQGAEGKKLTDLALRLPALQAIAFLDGDPPTIEQFPVAKKIGIRCHSYYPRKGVPGKRNYFDCYTVIDEISQKFFIIALHECEELVDESREILLKIVSSATFLS